MTNPDSIFRLLAIAILCAFVVGCKRSEEMRVYEISKSDSGFDSFEVVGELDVEPVVSRMVVGMVLRPDRTWTFKILGEKSVVDAAEADWKQFFATLSFDAAGEPVFEVPGSWSDKGVRQGMFSQIRTLVLDAVTDSKMEISSLTAGQGIAMNVNRWRGQLGLPPIQGEVELPEISYDGGELLLFDETGRFQGRGGPMFGGGGARSSRSSRPGNRRKPAADSLPSMKFAQPSDWDVKETSLIVVGRFEKKTDSGSVEMTFSRLPAVNEWELNAQAWAASIGLRNVSDEAIVENTEELEVAGEPAKKVRWSNDEEKTTLIGVMFKKDGMAWFAKLIGDTTSIEETESAFNEAVDSIQIQPAKN